MKDIGNWNAFVHVESDSIPSGMKRFSPDGNDSRAELISRETMNKKREIARNAR